MKQEMKTYKLGDIAKLSSGATPLTSKSEYYTNGDIPWVNSGDLSEPYIKEGKHFISKLGFKNSSVRMYPADTILLAMYGATAGKASLLQIEACTNQAICAIQVDKDSVVPLYLKYKLDSMYDYLVNLSSGSARDNLSQNGISKIIIAFPCLEEQYRVSDILFILDQKIALNKVINHNLEAMAKQLYEYWFVQFDFPDENGRPYKSSGGKMVWNEKLKREIPEGWSVTLLSNVAEVRKGETITAKEATKGNIKVVAGGINFSYYNGVCNRPKNTITISGSGANAGYINFWREPIFASDCSTVNCIDDLDTILCWYTLKLYQEVLYNFAVGAAQPHVYPNHVSNLPILVIPKHIKEKVRSFYCFSNDRMAKNEFEINILTKLRDELLPLLMNGQVSVNYDLQS